VTPGINRLKTWALIAGLGGLFVLVGAWIGGSTGVVIALAFGLVFNGAMYWYSDKIAIATTRSKPVTEDEYPQLYRIVRELAQERQMPLPKIYVSQMQQPNAFATGRSPEHAAVACTQGIMQMLSEDELKGVLAHELSHVGNRDILIGSVAAAIAMAITFVARMAMWGAMFGGGNDRDRNPIGEIAFAVLAPVAAMFLQMALSRSREFEADRSGAILLGTGEPLARALEKIEVGAKKIPMDVNPAQAQAYIVNPLTGRQVQFANLFRSHPPTADRVARLRSQEWARS